MAAAMCPQVPCILRHSGILGNFSMFSLKSDFDHRADTHPGTLLLVLHSLTVLGLSSMMLICVITSADCCQACKQHELSAFRDSFVKTWLCKFYTYSLALWTDTQGLSLVAVVSEAVHGSWWIWASASLFPLGAPLPLTTLAFSQDTLHRIHRPTEEMNFKKTFSDPSCRYTQIEF